MQDLVTVFGGSGFLGSQVVRVLAKQGHRVRVAIRQPNMGYKLRMLGDVGQIEVVQANVRNPASVRRALEGATACVNLVGILYETGRQRFQTLHAMGARNIAEAAKAAGITRFVQVSAIGADAGSTSKYARSKALGEAAVREVIPQAVIVRPSIVFGQGDGFFDRFGAMSALSPVLPLIGGGATRFQPVFLGDVARAIAAAATDPAHAGATYELAGPAVHSFRELLEMVLAHTGRRRFLAPVPFAVARLIGALCEPLGALTPVAPPLTRDQVELLRTDNVASGALPGLEAFGITPTALEPILGSYLYRYRRGGQYADQVAEATAV